MILSRGNPTFLAKLSYFYTKKHLILRDFLFFFSPLGTPRGELEGGFFIFIPHLTSP
jgi:hypothetical protein